ncbi:MAG: ABC transporter substrate-binding protein [bacterium]|nr:ABC transporter substrate-binding protein [bacterium]
MKIFSKVVTVIKSYDYRDKVISAAAVAVFLLMLVKMMIFPYGLFGFGETNIYTEGIVARSGIQNLNPLFVDYNEADREVSSLIFSGLMKYDLEKKAIVDDMGQLAINEEKTEYSFKVREGLKWHDGKAFTAEDVYFTFHDIVLHPSFQNEILKTNFGGVEMKLVDDMNILFKLEKPNVFFITNLTTGILPKHILDGVDPFEILKDDFNKKPIGTGPYMVTDPVESFADGRTQITLTQNPYYYGDRSDIELMRFIAYPTMDQLIEEIDAVNGVPKVSGNYILDFVNNERFDLYPYELPQYTAVFMNLESSILKDSKKVRLALQKAIDKDALIAGSMDKITVDTPLMSLNQEDWEYQSSTEQAMGALKDAGYLYQKEDKEHSGIRYNSDEEGLELNFIARLYDEGTYQYEESLKVVDFLKNSWEGIGFAINIQFLPPDEFKQRVMQRNYDLLLVGQTLGYNLDTYSYWHSTQATPVGQNFSNYKSFQVDSIIEAIRSTFDTEKEAEKLLELAERLKDDVPAIFLYRPLYYYASDSKIVGISMDGVVFPSDRFSKIWQWKFDR